MLKRILERGSFYNVSKWERDYERAQYYKRNHCIFPCIDFAKTQKYGFNAPFKGFGKGRSKSTYPPYGTRKREENPEEVKNGHEGEGEGEAEGEDMPKVLYQTRSPIKGLGECNIEFSVQTQK